MSNNIVIEKILRAAILVGVCLMTTMNGAQAGVFSVDEFFIEKGATSATRAEIFRDSFNDGVLPPSGPDGVATYNVRGNGFIAENTGGNGRLNIDTALGDVSSTTSASLFSRIRRLTSSNSSSPDALTIASSWAVHGIFDLSTLPQNNERIGLRLEDFGLGTPSGNDRLSLQVNRNDQGVLAVLYSGSNFNGVASELFDAVELQTLLDTFSSADQIQLSLFNDENSSFVGAEFSLLSGGASIFDQTLDNIGETTGLVAAVFSDDTVTRAAIIASATIAVPTPGAVGLFMFGLAGLGALRRTRKS
jgi:hypothetical protein